MRNLMSENPSLAQKLIAKIERGNSLGSNDSLDDERIIYLEAWGELPDPKSEWSLFSQWIADCLFRNYIKSKSYSDAMRWAEVSYSARPSEIETSCLVQLGQVNYELKNYKEAFEWFDKAYKVGQRRAFEGFDGKYLKLFLAWSKNGLPPN
jgi:tetratricopeptide (TPR) repeat protein